MAPSGQQPSGHDLGTSGVAPDPFDRKGTTGRAFSALRPTLELGLFLKRRQASKQGARTNRHSGWPLSSCRALGSPGVHPVQHFTF